MTLKRDSSLPLSKSKLHEQFQKIHAHGADEFGTLWLMANTNALRRVSAHYDVSRLDNKLLISAVILSTLRTARYNKEGL